MDNSCVGMSYSSTFNSGDTLVLKIGLFLIDGGFVGIPIQVWHPLQDGKDNVGDD